MTSALFAPLNDQAAEQLVGGKRFLATKTVTSSTNPYSVNFSVDDTQGSYDVTNGNASLDTTTGTWSLSFTFMGTSYSWSNA